MTQKTPSTCSILSSDQPAADAQATDRTPELTSADWLEMQVRDHALDRRLASMLKRDFPYEDYADCWSLAGLWIALWATKGTLDQHLAVTGSIRTGTLYAFLKQKHISALSQRAQEPLERLRGARTQHEMRVRRETGNDEYLCLDAVQSDSDVETVTLYDDDGEGESEVVETSNPETLYLHHRTETGVLDGGIAIVRAHHRGNPDRYERVFRALSAGASQDQIANGEGCSRLRAGHLMAACRKAIREGEVTVAVAAIVFAVVAEEPYTTRRELQVFLDLDAQIVKRALAYLAEQGEVVEAAGESYAVADIIR